MTRRVVIFGLDGATFTLLDYLVEQRVMPFLGEFLRDGSRGLLRSTVPHLTPPAWTTLVTGRSPGHHGIFNFLQFESPTSPYLRIISSRNIACETLWSIVSRAGMRVGSLNFVGHTPAIPVNGYMVPGWVPWRWVKKHSYPAGLLERLKEGVPSLDIKELAMNFKEEEKAVAGMELADYEPWIDLHIRREQQWFSILRHQMIHDSCALTGIVFDGVDKLQHLLWQFLDPQLAPAAPSPQFLQVRRRCWDYFRQLDEFLKETVWLAGPDAHVLVVSDHGFCATREIVYINTWLEQQGYLTWAPTATVESDHSQELGEAHPYHLTHLDLPKTSAYATSASSNGIHIAVRGLRGDGAVSPEDYLRFRDELRDALLTQCVDPQTGDPLITRVWTREEAFSGACMANAPDLTVELRDWGFFSVLRSNAVLKLRPVPMGCHHPDGVLAAKGPGVRQGTMIEGARLLDIAPTVMFLLGLPIPEDFEGRMLSSMFDPSYLDAHPVLCGPATRAAAAGGGEVECLDEESEAQVMMRLRALGYIE